MAYRQSLVRRAARRVIDPARDWIDDHDPTELFMSIVGIILIVGTLMVVFVATTPDPPTDTLISLSPRIGQAEPGVLAYENAIGGYGFTYPSGWELTESGGRSRLESPNGGVVLSFEVVTAGGLEETTTHLVESLGGSPSTRELIGTRRDQIAGSPSLLTSGIGEDEIGRPVRYLAVAIRGEPINYGISILVPAGSSPSRLLPILEQIVASFEVVEPKPRLIAAGAGVDEETSVDRPSAL